MPIYSRNQLSSIGVTHVAANESYKNTADLGRALYEAQVNDMAIFEAVLAADMHEITGLREGTLVQAEIDSLNEASLKGFFSALKERLKKIWEKIKSIFRQALAKISTWVVRDGKAFVALHRKSLTSMSFKGLEVPNYRLPKEMPSDVVKIPDVTQLDLIRNADYDEAENLTTVLLNGTLSTKDTVTSANFVKELMDKCFEDSADVPASKLKISAMMDNLSTGGKLIKDIRKAEKDREKDIRKAIKDLDTLEAKLTKNEDKDGASLTSRVSKYVSALEVVCSKTTKAQIKLMQFSMSQDRRALGYLVGHGIKENTLLEAVAAEDDVEQLAADLESPLAAEVTPEVEEIIDAANEE